MNPKYFLLPLLGSMFPLESAVGLNGRVWINTKSIKHTIAATRCIQAADPDGERLGERAIRELLKAMGL